MTEKLRIFQRVSQQDQAVSTCSFFAVMSCAWTHIRSSRNYSDLFEPRVWS